MSNINILSNYLKTCEGKITDVLYEIWDIIDNCGDNEKIPTFRFFCENHNNIQSDGSIETKRNYFTDEQASNSIERLIQKDINGKIENLIETSIQNNFSEEYFYELLWQTVIKTFKSKRDKALSLFFIMESNLLPYKNVGSGKEMSQEDYEKYIDKIGKEKINEINYIFDLELKQKTQTSSLLLERLLSIKDSNEQIVYLSLILEHNKENIVKGLKSFIEGI